jgi:acetyl-CoA acetyltransferase
MSGGALRRVVVSGTGYSRIARHIEEPIGLLAVEAARRALDEAGLTVDDVDGLANFPAAGHASAGSVDGVDHVGTGYLSGALPSRNLRWQASVQPGDFISSMIAGMHAIAAGTCEVVLVWRAMHNPRNRRYGQVTGGAAVGEYEFTAPYGVGDALSRYAMPYSRYLGKYGARREQMATFVVNNRRNAAMNPDAVFYQRPITVEDYLGARMIVEPFSILDCDMPVDGAGAVVLTTEANAQSARYPAAHLSGHATLGVARGIPANTILEDHQQAAAQGAAALWSTTTLTPSDVDSANLYDGFSYFTYLYLEALGFCGEGEAADFIQGGRIAVDGKLPLNTSGGSLGMGRVHGPPQVIESVRQLQGRGGERQIVRPGVILAVTGQPNYSAGYVLLTREPVPPRPRRAAPA